MSRSTLPFVSINMAMTADGKIATANRNVSTFGSRRDLTHLYELRAAADAVMCGARTIELNETKLGPGGRRYERQRVREGLCRFNLRVAVSGAGSLDPDAPLFQHRFSPIIVITSSRAPRSRLQALRNVADDVFVAGDDEINFTTALQHLRRNWGVRRLLCEGGAELNDALFRAGLVHELNLTLCPYIVGGRNAPTIADGLGVSALSHACRMKLTSSRRIADEQFLVYAARPQRISTTS